MCKIEVALKPIKLPAAALSHYMYCTLAAVS